MTKPDEKLGLDPDFYASRLEKMYEATQTCSFCCRSSPQTKRMVKSLNGGAICNGCLNALLAALPHFYALKPEDGVSKKCLFCERLSPEVHHMTELGGIFICQDCVIDADINLQRYDNKLLETGQDDRWDGGPIEE
jgi:ClpX C4-type zinc finger